MRACVNPEVGVLRERVLPHDSDEVSQPRVYAEVVLFIGPSPLFVGFESFHSVVFGVTGIAGEYLYADGHVHG